MKRDISGSMLRTCFGVARKGVTPTKILTSVLDEMATTQRDLDITGDMDSAYYYEGMIDAFEMVAVWIAPLKKEKEAFYNSLVGKIGTRFAEEAS